MWAAPLLDIGSRLWVLLRRTAVSRRTALVVVLLVITWFTGARLLNEGLHAHTFDFGNEALRAVQAWENHGFFSMGGMYPWGRGYLDAASFPQTIYRSKTPLALLPLWLGYRLVGESGFHLFKLYWSLAVVLLMGLLLAAIATSCFASRRAGDRQLVFAATYAIAITNEALLRYCLVDEPQYLGLFLHLLGVFLLLKWLRGPTAGAAGLRGVIGVFFLASWTYPILGGINAVIAMGLKRLRPDRRLRRALGAIGFASLLGPVLYFLQRWTVSAMFPNRLVGQRLPTRMGFTPDNNFHDGVFDALNFLFWQKSGETMESSGVALSHAIEHYAVWILGMVLFVLCLSRIRRDRQLLLILSAGQMWLFIPLFHQTLSQHPWIYGILYTPTVVLGWVGAPTLLLPHLPGDSFPAFVMVGVAVLIWAIQLRFFLVNYLG